MQMDQDRDRISSQATTTTQYRQEETHTRTVHSLLAAGGDPVVEVRGPDGAGHAIRERSGLHTHTHTKMAMRTSSHIVM